MLTLGKGAGVGVGVDAILIPVLVITQGLLLKS
jgi:hypothetical protein